MCPAKLVSSGDAHIPYPFTLKFSDSIFMVHFAILLPLSSLCFPRFITLSTYSLLLTSTCLNHRERDQRCVRRSAVLLSLSDEVHHARDAHPLASTQVHACASECREGEHGVWTNDGIRIEISRDIYRDGVGEVKNRSR